MKRIYCHSITPMALSLIRRFEGDVVENEAIICHYLKEEPSINKYGKVVEGAFKITFPDQQAICYTLSGEIAYVL